MKSVLYNYIIKVVRTLTSDLLGLGRNLNKLYYIKEKSKQFSKLEKIIIRRSKYLFR